MEHLLVAALAVAAILYFYDLVITGPAPARVLLTVATATLHVWGVDRSASVEHILIYGAGAGFLALLLVALVQWLMVARDAAMVSAMRGRR